MKVCTKCNIEKALAEFDKRSGTRAHLYKSWCRQCSREYTKQYQQRPGYAKTQSQRWRAANPERYKELNKKSKNKRHAEIRLELIQAYGGKCNCCGETDPHFLTIEHKDGRREEHHRGMSGASIMYMIKKEGYPDKYTILCWNCNCSKGIYGFCPHQPHDESMRKYV